MPITYTLKSRLPIITQQAMVRAPLVVEKTARDIQAGAVVRTPPRVDTGNMMNGWSAEEIGELTWVVYNPVEYTIYHEFGAPANNLSPHPMLIPSLEEAKEPFLKAMEQIYG